MEKKTFVQISFHIYSLTNTVIYFLKTVSAYSLLQESYCWRDGRKAFK